MKILKEIKNSPFKDPIKKYYIGKIIHGTPYFYPMYFHKSIFNITKLVEYNAEEIIERKRLYSHFKGDKLIFKNLPIVRRTKDYRFRLFKNEYIIQYG
jgi:hypothetical protein